MNAPHRVYRWSESSLSLPSQHGLGYHADRVHEEDARAGSFMLRERIERQFRKAEWKFGLQEGDGVHLLLNNGQRL